jgi:hypothetical protein
MPFIIKINIRESNTGSSIRTIRQFNSIVYHKKFNSLASTFDFDFYFDPKNSEHAEIICVSHIHECRLYYTTNTDPNYNPKESERELTGFMLTNVFRNDGKPNFVKCSGYSKPGVLLDCDIPPDQYPLETNKLNFKQIILKLIKPFNLWAAGDPSTRNGNSPGLVVPNGTNVSFGIDPNFRRTKTQLTPAEQQIEDELDIELDKTSAETSQNIAAYISELARDRNIVLSHNEFGNVYITVPNTNGNPLFNFDFTDTAEISDFKKTPALTSQLTFNGQAMHTHITVKKQADDEEGSNGQEATLKNPLLPIGQSYLYRPKTVVINSGNQFTAEKAVAYELGKEIREAVSLEITCGIIDIKGKLISPNNTITIRDPNQFLYNKVKNSTKLGHNRTKT